MKTYFKAQIIKMTQVDDYENGCLPDTCQDYGLITTLIHTDLKGLVKEIESFCNGQVFLFEDENNRLGVQVLENSDGYKASPGQVERWKNKEITLYLADYSCYISKFTEENDVLKELESLNIETI